MCKRFKKIARIVSDIVGEASKNTNVSMLNYHFLFYQVMQRDAIFRNKYQATIEKEKIGWESALRNSVSKKEIKQDTDIEVSAMQLFTLTDGIWFQSIFSTDGNSIVQMCIRDRIDGDIILEKHFVEDHHSFAQKGCFTSGSRVKLSPKSSAEVLRNGTVDIPFSWSRCV